LNSFEKWFVWVASILAGVTGVGYFYTKYMIENTDPFSVVNHPLEPWLLKGHILLSPLLLLALGSIFVRHVWRHYRGGIVLGRKSGLSAALVFLPMAATGYLVQTVVAPAPLQVIVWSHIAFSVAYVAGIAAHQVLVHRRGAGNALEADESGLQAELLRARGRRTAPQRPAGGAGAKRRSFPPEQAGGKAPETG
jgi:hypothetical protein